MPEIHSGPVVLAGASSRSTARWSRLALMPPWVAACVARGSSASFARLAAVFALVFLPGCSSSPPAPIRFGINSWPGYELVYLAQEQGFFKAQGCAVSLVEFSSLSDARLSYEKGRLDGLATTPIELIYAKFYNPVQPRIVRAVDCSEGADAIIAPRRLSAVRELRGRRIGVESGSVSSYVLLRALQSHGLSLADVQPIPGPQFDLVTNLERGELDAVVSYPPHAAALLAAPEFHKIFSSADIPGEVVDVIAFEAEFLKRRPDDVKAFLRALEQAWGFLQQHPDVAVRIMAAREHVPPAEFQRMLTDGMRLLGPADQAAYLGPAGKLATILPRYAQTLLESHMISRPVAVSDLLTPL